MKVGDALLDLARAGGHSCVFVAGTGKNAGKTVTASTIRRAAEDRGLRIGTLSIGRDGETADALDGGKKPSIFLKRGTIAVTTPALLRHSPAAEVLAVPEWQTAAGRIAIVRVRAAGFYQIAGPATAKAVRRCIAMLRAFGCNQTIVDGAVDRLAAIATVRASIVLTVGADTAPTLEGSAEAAGALARRLRIRAYDPAQPFLRIEGALTAQRAAQLRAAGERRQIVVRDPTHVVLDGTFARPVSSLQIRCERELKLVALTVASIGRERYFEPNEFLRAVASVAALPVFDPYTGAAA